MNTHSKLAKKSLGFFGDPNQRADVTFDLNYFETYLIITVWIGIAVKGEQHHSDGHQNAHSKS